MKQIFQSFKNGKVELLDIPAPLVEKGFVLVKNQHSLLSLGTEKSFMEMSKKFLLEKARQRPDLVKQVLDKVKSEGIISAYKKTNQKLNEAIALGYSCSGEVIAVGKGVDEFKVGDKVACAGQGYASHGEIVRVPKNLCVKSSVDLEESCFVALGAIALQGIRRANLTSGEKVAVIGLGLIGQLTVQMLKAYGHPVFGIDIDQEKIDLGLKFGMDQGALVSQDVIGLVNSFTNGVGIDAVIICAGGKNQPIELAGEILRDRGRVSAVGDIGLNIPRRTFFKKEIDVFISRSYGPGRYDPNYEEKGQDYPIAYVRWTEKRNMEEFIRLIKEGKVQPQKLITHRFNIDQAESAYNLVLKNPNQEKIIGVVFKYSDQSEKENIVSVSKQYSKQSQVKVGLIGVGSFAQNIILPELGKKHVYALADSNGEKAIRAANKYEAKYATTDYKKIINDPEINLIAIATRHNNHAEIAKQALENNKNVYLEKPIGLNQEQVNQVIEAAKRSKGRLMIGYNRRFSPYSLKAKEIFKNPLTVIYRINAGFIPKDHWVHDPEQGGGRIIGEVCHFIDLVQFLTGSKIEQVYAESIPLKKEVTTKDNLVISLSFKNGSKASIIYNTSGSKSFSKEYLEIYGQGKTMIINDFKQAEVFDGPRLIKRLGHDKGHKNQFKKFIEIIEKGQDDPISLDHLLNSSQTVFAIEKSIEQNKPIKINGIKKQA